MTETTEEMIEIEDRPSTIRDPNYINEVPKGEPTIVYWHGRGPYHCVHMKHSHPQRNGQADLTPIPFVLLPGLNLKDSGFLDLLKDNNPLFLEKIERGDIEEIGAPKLFAKVIKPNRATDMVTSSASREALEAILEYEKREEVINAIQDELAELRRKDNEDADERRNQRRARRRSTSRGRRR